MGRVGGRAVCADPVEFDTGVGSVGIVTEWFLTPDHILVNGGNCVVAVQSDLKRGLRRRTWFASTVQLHFPSGVRKEDILRYIKRQFMFEGQSMVELPGKTWSLDQFWRSAFWRCIPSDV